MVEDQIGADRNPFLTGIFQKIAVSCFPSSRGSLSTLIHNELTSEMGKEEMARECPLVGRS